MSCFTFKQKVARSFNQAAIYYDQAANMQKMVATKLLDHITPHLQAAKTIVDLGCGTGFISQQINQRFPKTHRIFALDIAERMLHWKQNNFATCLCGDIDAMPFQSNQIDLMISNLALQWSQNLSASLNEIYRVLKPGGYFSFTTLGPKTLYELRYCWSQIDNNTHINDFLNQTEIFNLLQQVSFNKINISTETIQLNYDSLYDLMDNLKKTGAHNINAGQPKSLLGKSVLDKLQQCYIQFQRSKQQLPASYDIIYINCEKTND